MNLKLLLYNSNQQRLSTGQKSSIQGNQTMGQRQPSGTPFKNTFKSVGNV